MQEMSLNQTFWEQPPLHVCIRNFLPDTFDYSEIEALSQRLDSLDVFELTEKEMKGSLLSDLLGVHGSTAATLRALQTAVDRLCERVGTVCGCECFPSTGFIKVRPHAGGQVTRLHTDTTYNEDTEHLEREIFIALTDASQLTRVHSEDTFRHLKNEMKKYRYTDIPNDSFALRDCPETRRGSAVVFDLAAVHAAPAHDNWRIVATFGYRISADVDVARERRALLDSF